MKKAELHPVQGNRTGSMGQDSDSIPSTVCTSNVYDCSNMNAVALVDLAVCCCCFLLLDRLFVVCLFELF
jgi:hypothetical protein